jgi:exosortase/archaeosortase family protein
LSIFSLGLFYFLLRLFVLETDPLIPLLNSIYRTYLLLPEWIANAFFNLLDAGVSIENHILMYENTGPYQESYATFIDNWPKYLMHKRWSLLLLVVIWSIITSVRRKIRFTALFIMVHIVSVVAGLYLIGVTGPKIVDENTSFFLSPTLAGNLLMFILLLLWAFKNKQEISTTFQKLGIKIEISDRKIHEILLLLFFFFILRDYLIPFLAFKPYVNFFLEVTRGISSLFGHNGNILGVHLIGANGALALAKHCLGFMTMYVFVSVVYFTRPNNMVRITWLFIAGGSILIFLSNIARLVLVFVIAQGENGYHRASMHHEVYNIGVYIFIFLMWVVWFEKIRKKNSKIDNYEKQNNIPLE